MDEYKEFCVDCVIVACLQLASFTEVKEVTGLAGTSQLWPDVPASGWAVWWARSAAEMSSFWAWMLPSQVAFESRPHLLDWY